MSRQSRRTLLAAALIVTLGGPARGEIPQNRPNVDLSGVCSQKNQGALGTCGAFSLSCPLEIYESHLTPGFAVSENWLVFVDVLDRLCAPGNTAVAVNQGHYPRAIAARLMTLGYCAAGSYLPYNGADGARSEGGSPSQEVYRALVEQSTGGVRSTMTTAIAAKFRQAFGISATDAASALCGGTDQQKIQRVNALGAGVDARFRQCFTASMQMKPRMNASCHPAFASNAISRAQKTSYIKRMLDAGQPILFTMADYVPNIPQHALHAISIVGYNEATQQFLVHNSWGSAGNYPIAYNRADGMTEIGSLYCVPAQAPGSSPAHAGALGSGQLVHH